MDLEFLTDSAYLNLLGGCVGLNLGEVEGKVGGDVGTLAYLLQVLGAVVGGLHPPRDDGFAPSSCFLLGFLEVGFSVVPYLGKLVQHGVGFGDVVRREPRDPLGGDQVVDGGDSAFHKALDVLGDDRFDVGEAQE